MVINSKYQNLPIIIGMATLVSHKLQTGNATPGLLRRKELIASYHRLWIDFDYHRYLPNVLCWLTFGGKAPLRGQSRQSLKARHAPAELATTGVWFFYLSVWILEFRYCLEFGAWNLEFPLSVSIRLSEPSSDVRILETKGNSSKTHEYTCHER
jgi:hypothetical protein